MGNWYIVEPEETTNKVKNPVFGIDDGYTAIGGAPVTRITTAGVFGLTALSVTGNGDNTGVSLELTPALANATHYVTMFMSKGAWNDDWDWSLDNANWTTPTEIMDIDGTWQLYGASFPAAQANGSTTLYIQQNGAGAGIAFTIDGVQVEEKDHYTTLCYGDDPDCLWLAKAHDGPSYRARTTLSGGRLRDLEDVYSFYVEKVVGVGSAPLRVSIDSYALIPGGYVNAIRDLPRDFVIAGTITGTSLANLHTNRQALAEVLRQYGPGNQSLTLWYDGASTVKRIHANYIGGMEATLEGKTTNIDAYERVALQFTAADPYWHGIGDEGAYLDTSDTATMRYVGARLRSTDQWSILGMAADPTTNGTIYAVCAASDGRVYYGGDFTGFGGNAGWDYMVAYNLASSAWEQVGSDNDVTGIVYDIIEAPGGFLYVAGAFQDVAAVGDADYLCIYTFSTDAFTALSTNPATGATIANIRALAFDRDGLLYMVGDFIQLGNDADCDNIATWDGSSFADVGGGSGKVAAGTQPVDVAVDSQGNVWICGSAITDWDGQAAMDNWAYYDADAADWSAITTSKAATPCLCVEVDKSDTFWIGIFGGTVATVKGSIYTTLLSTLDDNPRKILISPNNQPIILCDTFAAESVGQVTRWTGSGFSDYDIALGVGEDIYAGDIAQVDPITKQFSLFIGTEFSASVEFAGDTTVTNNGSAQAFPRIAISRSGGTSARIVSIHNATTDQWLFFDYSLQDGEVLTIDLRPGIKTITSDFYGERPDAIKVDSDFSAFSLVPGANLVTALVANNGATVSALVLWEKTFLSQD